MTLHFDTADATVDHILAAVGKTIVLGIPLGLGKPNQLVNALYRRAKSDPSIHLDILTALSLEKPRAASALEARVLDPFVARVWGDHAELEYLQDRRNGAIPDNIRVIEFFMKSGDWLDNPYAQQHYISSNYTHAPRDLLARGVNVVAQLVAHRRQDNRYSLACNPEVTLDLYPELMARRAQGEKNLFIGQVHKDLPFMPHDAEVDESFLDVVLEHPDYHTTLFPVPNASISAADHMIGLHASTLVRDGGTLQLGIGSLCDAIAWSLCLRHTRNARYLELLQAAGIPVSPPGDTAPFTKGLYGASEMVVNGFLELMKAGILKRAVDDGIVLHGGFFLGSTAFYKTLRDLPEAERNKINMTRISYVNALYGNENTKREQRQHARFINTAFMATIFGHAVSDALEDGRVVSGVGGQYNFVAQAHELRDARSILMLRAVREKNGKATSNIVFNYGHTTIPRHLRDMVITEYGVADLRGKTDSEVVAAMLNITDSRFQQGLLQQAKAAGKIAAGHVIPDMYRNNTPASIHAIAAKHREVLPAFPFGHDFTDAELELLAALKQAKARHPLQLLRLLWQRWRQGGKH